MCYKKKSNSKQDSQATQPVSSELQLNYNSDTYTNNSSSLPASEIWNVYNRNPRLNVTIQYEK